MSTSGDKPSIVFFGTGPVAAASLDLLTNSFTIEAVITKPRPPHHKGSVPVLELATKLGTRTITANNAKELSELIAQESFVSRVGVLIDFGIIVRQDVIDAFPLGIINSHFSLLPEWRGADPITFSILSGQKLTGVSLMKVVEKLDEGDILAFGLVDLDGTETNQSLTNGLINSVLRSCEITSHTILKVPRSFLRKIAAVVPEVDYPHIASYSHKISKIDGVLDLSKPAIQLEREVRAYLAGLGAAQM
ncbi:hypothetical protein IPL68_04290 [Candidatus Saccharibacteria bacterium]|nr:MAG: hypothetical protein IPL68_04290 [Candidatus Saccharibacteria bacterium]